MGAEPDQVRDREYDDDDSNNIMCKTPCLKDLLRDFENSLSSMKLAEPSDLKTYLTPHV